nr:testis-specific Y-encoded-like protein 2 isoform X4 [Halyomorpha halys]
MPFLMRTFVVFMFRTVIGSIVFALTLLRRVYERIQYPNNMLGENNESLDVTATALAIENVQDSDPTNKSPERNNENVVRKEEQAGNNEPSFSQVANTSNENQSTNGPNSSFVLVNTNEENISEENQNNTDEIIVATLALILEFCDMCVIL